VDRNDGEPDDDVRFLPPGVRAIHAELAARRWRSQAEAEAFLQRRMAQYNATPQDELGGLSPLQAHGLLSGDWRTTGPLRLNEALSIESFRDCHVLHAARALLAAAAEPKGIKATTAGNLNRKTVAALLEAAPWPAGYVEETHRWNKVINEEDFHPVHVLRLVLEIGRLLRRRSGAFRRELARLRARYPTLDGEPEDAGSADLRSFAFSSFVHRILNPLEWFGLLEGREVPGFYPSLPDREMRKTALFDAFITFPAPFTTAASHWSR
jgi:hypothetical protein